jgi:metal-responsive CopG/Arc/MetJ family transcriptional regulator
MATKTKKTTKILLSLPVEDLKELDRVAVLRHKTRTELIRDALREKYLRYERTPEQQARVEEAFKHFEALREKWKEPFDSAKEIRKMRDSR